MSTACQFNAVYTLKELITTPRNEIRMWKRPYKAPKLLTGPIPLCSVAKSRLLSLHRYLLFICLWETQGEPDFEILQSEWHFIHKWDFFAWHAQHENDLHVKGKDDNESTTLSLPPYSGSVSDDKIWLILTKIHHLLPLFMPTAQQPCLW